MLLADLAIGHSAVVDGLEDSDAVARRLGDLGFVPGTRVVALRRAPLGDPTEFELRGTRICLRAREARRIRVRGEGPAA